MPVMEWTDDLDVGFGEINEQHKRWIAIYNKAHERMMGGRELETLAVDALREMVDYTRYHFECEEKLMADIGYPDLERHSSLHLSFTRRLDEISDQVERGTIFLNSEIIKVIQSWLVNHIMTEDKKIARNSG